MKKQTSTTFALLLLLSTSAYSQSLKTLYIQKRETLKIKLFNDLGLPISLINSTANVGDFFDSLIYKLDDEKSFLLLKKYKQDLKAAESLRTPEELKRTTRAGEPTAKQIEETSIYSTEKQIPSEDDNTVYNFVSMENPPSYPGGSEKFYDFLYNNIKYPEEAKNNNIQGNVFISFTVEKNGALTEIKIDRKLGYGTDEEAMRVLKLSKRWNPGMQNGKPVRVKYNIPVKFSLPK